ncbi:MAG: protein translocase subunit SecF [Planctomycetes bacterium]|nr:protein translocase subunit SecF [Planctomycetota bacterium]
MEYGRAWKIVTSFPSVERLERAVQRLFAQGEENLLMMREVSYTPPEAIGAAPPAKQATGKAESPKEKAPAPKAKTAPDTPEKTPPSEPAETSASPDGPRAAEPRPPVAPEEPASTDGASRRGRGGFSVEELSALRDSRPKNHPDPFPSALAMPRPVNLLLAAQTFGQVGASESVLTFRYSIDDDALKFQLESAASDIGVDLDADAVAVQPLGEGNREWRITMPLAPDAAARVLEELQADFAQMPVFPSASKIGGKVAADMQRTAGLALLLSLVGIVIYLWIRFQRVAYGLAAVAAVVHDILVMLGAVALSYWLATAFGFLLIENFKISLPVVAAFLTIIGYSLNDTIVIFDRIREIKGKSPRLTQEMVNASVNQTLSRTILTSGTTLVVVGILYALGGQGIHGFAFAMLVGVVAGTYSTIYIASPVLLWLTESAAKAPAAAPAAEEKVAKVTAR